MSLTVISGPDVGLTRVYEHGRVTVGRDSRNDFVLSDGFVSNHHAELLLENNTIIFRDLRSRHGSLILADQLSLQLRDADKDTQAQIPAEAELQVGSSRIQLKIIEYEPVYVPALSPVVDHELNVHVLEEITPSGSKVRQQYITTTHQSVDVLTHRFDEQGKQLDVLFRLAGQLNGLTALDDILGMIVEAVFEAFPAAKYFAVMTGEDIEEIKDRSPLMSRIRDSTNEGEASTSPTLSTSILRRVIQTRESVLFVKDSMGSNISQSIINAKITACMCAPLVGQRSLLGVMLVDTHGKGSLFSRKELDLFTVFASNAAFAIERARLSESIFEMFEGFVGASVNAIEGRDPATAGHSARVAQYSVELAEVVNEIETGVLANVRLDANELIELRYAALLHDFGKIAVREEVLQKDARLPESRMKVIEERFETIAEAAHHDMYREIVQDVRASKFTPITEEQWIALEHKHAHFLHELAQLLQWIRLVASAPFLSDEQITRMRQLGQRTFIDSRGNQRFYIERDEIEHLCIQRGTLSELEWDNMRSHAAFSEEYLRRIPWSQELKNVPCIAGAHHEKLDGSGYPKGLTSEAILPQVRMLTVADIFDALTASDRPYRKAASVEKAIAILREDAAAQRLDHDLVDVFARLVVPRIAHVIPNR